MSQNLADKSRFAQLTTKISYALLLLMLAYTSLTIELPEKVSIWVVLAVKFIPLLIVLPGLLLNKLRSYIWLCFIVLFYFTRASVDIVLKEGIPVVDSIITALTVILFLSAMYFVKFEKAQGKSI